MPTHPSSLSSHAHTRTHHQPDSSPPGLAQWACYKGLSVWVQSRLDDTYIRKTRAVVSLQYVQQQLTGIPCDDCDDSDVLTAADPSATATHLAKLRLVGTSNALYDISCHTHVCAPQSLYQHTYTTYFALLTSLLLYLFTSDRHTDTRLTASFPGQPG